MQTSHWLQFYLGIIKGIRFRLECEGVLSDMNVLVLQGPEAYSNLGLTLPYYW